MNARHPSRESGSAHIRFGPGIAQGRAVEPSPPRVQVPPGPPASPLHKGRPPSRRPLPKGPPSSHPFRKGGSAKVRRGPNHGGLLYFWPCDRFGYTNRVCISHTANFGPTENYRTGNPSPVFRFSRNPRQAGRLSEVWSRVKAAEIGLFSLCTFVALE